VISTHHIHEVDRLVDHVGVLQRGHLVAQVSRDEMHRSLRLYRAEVPADWPAHAAVPGTVVARTESPREIRWTVWGAEQEIAAALTRSGAVVRAVTPLPLDEAVITLLRSKEIG
jgi:ABC-type multidrug transport system ATPase subunit